MTDGTSVGKEVWTVSRYLIVLCSWLLVGAPLGAQTPGQAAEGPAIVAAGEGLVKRPPDRAWLQITAESRARNARDAQKANSDTMATVLKKLEGAGLKPDAIQTRGYDLQPEFDYHDGRQTLRGYVARNSLEIRVDELSRVGELLEMAVSFGATSVGNIRFDLKDRAGAEREALRLAVEDARRRADAAAAGAGLKVERIVRIEEQRASVSPPPRPMVMMAGMAAERSAGEPPIAAGELEIRAHVTMTVAIR